MSDKQMAIHCRNTEEFNFVCNLFNITNANWFLHENRTCVNLPEKTISDIECNNRDYITGFRYAETYYSELLEKERHEFKLIHLATENEMLKIELDKANKLLKKYKL